MAEERRMERERLAEKMKRRVRFKNPSHPPELIGF
jgi:hypothetical protein